MEVVAEHRMEYAAMLLRQGRMKIAEISELAGYGSEAAFSRRFSRHFGISPSQLREEARAARDKADEAKPQRRHGLLAIERKRPVEDSGETKPEAGQPSRQQTPARGMFIAKGRRD